MNPRNPILVAIILGVSVPHSELAADEEQGNIIDPKGGKIIPLSEWKSAINQEEWIDDWIDGKGNREPEEYYFEAWKRVKKSEDFALDERIPQVAAALRVFEALKTRSPEWKSDLLEQRISSTKQLYEQLKGQQAAP